MAFDRIRDNIADTLRDLRRLDIGRTRDRLHKARVLKNRKKRARREFLDVRDDSLAELADLIEAGRDPHSDHLRNLQVRATKADRHADELGEMRADFARIARALRRALRSKHKRRGDLLHKLKQQRKRLRAARRRAAHEDAPTTGVGTFDGKAVAAWLIPVLQSARNNGWDGTLTSGYRTPAASIAICQGYCGAPTCSSPIPCAGAGSNHAKYQKPDGAVDVSDPAGFDAAQNVIWNALGSADPWHFSTSGR